MIVPASMRRVRSAFTSACLAAAASAAFCSAVMMIDGSGVHIGGLLVVRDCDRPVCRHSDRLRKSDGLRRVWPMRQDEGQMDFAGNPLDWSDNPFARDLASRNCRPLGQAGEVERFAVDGDD